MKFIGRFLTGMLIVVIATNLAHALSGEANGGAPQTGKTITVTLSGSTEMEFVYISPGTFTMGSPSSESGRGSHEGPQHEVTISEGFYLGKYEVMQGQWEAVMGDTPWSGQNLVQANGNHPAVYVSWDDVQIFVQKLNAAAGDSLYRLPSEAEWEYVCRAETTARWAFGDDKSELTNYAWYTVNAWDVGERYAHAVGTKLPNPWGLHDMHGNVWEWCQDWYGSSWCGDSSYYSNSPSTDPPGLSTGSTRVLRGGGFLNFAQGVRSALRGRNSPSYRYFIFGFRLLRRVK